MNTTNKKELSYFRLKLESYLSEHFPKKAEDKPFIKARADEALTTYCDAVEEGFSYPEAESMASEVLYRDLHFSKYDTLVSVLENEFEKELPSPLPERLSQILLGTRRYKTYLTSITLRKNLLQHLSMIRSIQNWQEQLYFLLKLINFPR